MRQKCTACEKIIKRMTDLNLHPVIKAMICHECLVEHGQGDFSRRPGGTNLDGSDNICRWCCQRGRLIQCTNFKYNHCLSIMKQCPYAFCWDCCERNFPEGDHKDVKEWTCYACDKTKLKIIRDRASRALASYDDDGQHPAQKTDTNHIEEGETRETKLEISPPAAKASNTEKNNQPEIIFIDDDDDDDDDDQIPSGNDTVLSSNRNVHFSHIKSADPKPANIVVSQAQQVPKLQQYHNGTSNPSNSVATSSIDRTSFVAQKSTPKKKQKSTDFISGHDEDSSISNPDNQRSIDWTPSIGNPKNKEASIELKAASAKVDINQRFDYICEKFHRYSKYYISRDLGPIPVHYLHTRAGLKHDGTSKLYLHFFENRSIVIFKNGKSKRIYVGDGLNWCCKKNNLSRLTKALNTDKVLRSRRFPGYVAGDPLSANSSTIALLILFAREWKTFPNSRIKDDLAMTFPKAYNEWRERLDCLQTSWKSQSEYRVCPDCQSRVLLTCFFAHRNSWCVARRSRTKKKKSKSVTKARRQDIERGPVLSWGNLHSGSKALSDPTRQQAISETPTITASDPNVSLGSATVSSGTILAPHERSVPEPSVEAFASKSHDKKDQRTLVEDKKPTDYIRTSES